jgi:hypothetical protein
VVECGSSRSKALSSLPVSPKIKQNHHDIPHRILKLTGKCKRPKTANAILSKKTKATDTITVNSKMYYRVTVTKTA